MLNFFSRSQRDARARSRMARRIRDELATIYETRAHLMTRESVLSNHLNAIIAKDVTQSLTDRRARGW